MKNRLLGILVPLLLITACGASAGSGQPGVGGTSGAAGGAGGAQAVGGGFTSGSGGAINGSAGTANGGSAGGSVCMNQLLTTDPDCPADVTATFTPACPKEGLVCEWRLTTSTPGLCVTSSVSCCGGAWTGAQACPKPIAGQNAACPADLPQDNGTPPACSSEGLQCAYSLDDGLQQSIGCCTGHWQFCFETSVLGPASCPCTTTN
jgi:hypothetical protein